MDVPTIVVIGASSGGFAVLQQLVRDLPADLPAALFVVWHVSPDSHGVLPAALNRAGALPVGHAVDGESIAPGRIFVAPPDRHLLVERGRVRVTRGPKEHRFRPAVDPLFRSAAFAYGPRVVGVVLSGALDDGSAGLRTIKRRGGIAIVQDPLDADVPSMPRNAMRACAVDHVVPAAELADLLVRLSRAPSQTVPEGVVVEDEKTAIEIRIAAADSPFEAGVMKLGEPTPFTCPECHGVLLAMPDGPLRRFRCHTGHAFSADSLLAAITSTAEDQLWSALRSLDENVLLLTHLGDHFAEANQPAMAAVYYQHAAGARRQAQLVRHALGQHELLTAERLQHQAEALDDTDEPECREAH
jgi:two-component system, chemotaxis family, protein-glutamate methylesterase/glutaminase